MSNTITNPVQGPSQTQAGTVANVPVLDVTAQTFDQEVLKSTLPVLVDFWAPWCGPCKAAAPLVQQTANDYASKLKVVKFNVDSDMTIPSNYGIQGIPTFLIFKGGVCVDRTFALPKKYLYSIIDKHV